MAADYYSSPDDEHAMRRRAFLDSTFRIAGVALTMATATGCEEAARHSVSQVRHTPLPQKPLKPPPRGDRIGHRPNDGSGVWADFSNTGYKHDPGYTGSGGNCVHGYSGLNDYATEMKANKLLYVDEPAGAVFNQIHFRGTVMLGHGRGDDWTFNGCVFDNAGDGTGSADFITQTYLPSFYTQNYCTFKPIDYATPPGNNGTVATSPTSPGTRCSSSWQSFNTNSNGSQTGQAVVTRSNCDIWGNAGMQDIGNGTAGKRVILDWCYIHDQADTDNSGGCGYHNDGIGPLPGGSAGAVQYMDITNCTIASLGNTNAVAFQQCAVHDCLITGNYFAGFGYTVNLGGTLGTTSDRNITFTNNVFSSEIPAIYWAAYARWSWNYEINAMLWRNNRFQFFSSDPYLNRTYAGKYWWPSDIVPHNMDYSG